MSKKNPQASWPFKNSDKPPQEVAIYRKMRELTERKASRSFPPPGPSNIIVRTANPLPAPKSVDSQ
jgi:hypothetical protein